MIVSIVQYIDNDIRILSYCSTVVLLKYKTVPFYQLLRTIGIVFTIGIVETTAIVIVKFYYCSALVPLFQFIIHQKYSLYILGIQD